MSLWERLKDDILTDNTALNHFAQCKTCTFRNKTTVNGEECGWKKGFCEKYKDSDNNWTGKPRTVYKNTAQCDFYEEELNEI